MNDVCIESTDEFMEYIKEFNIDTNDYSITDARFSNVDFSRINGHSIRFMRCAFCDCTNISMVADGLYECLFRNCIFNKSDMRFIHHICYCEFDSCKINDLSISARIYECTFKLCHINNICVNGGSLINEITLEKCDIIKVSFRYCSKCSLIVINNSKIINCDFSEIIECHGVHISNNTTVENTKVPFIRDICPDGEFVGYKSVSLEGYFNPGIVTLLIPADAKRLSSINGKCRCDKAKVLAIEYSNGEPLDTNSYGTSRHSKSQVTYKVGEWVYADSFNEDPFIECSNGIHFFMTKEEAINYER